MLYDVLGGRIISHITVFEDMWKTQRKTSESTAYLY